MDLMRGLAEPLNDSTIKWFKLNPQIDKRWSGPRRYPSVHIANLQDYYFEIETDSPKYIGILRIWCGMIKGGWHNIFCQFNLVQRGKKYLTGNNYNNTGIMSIDGPYLYKDLITRRKFNDAVDTAILRYNSDDIQFMKAIEKLSLNHQKTLKSDG